MIKTKVVTIKTQSVLIEDVTCNKCGQSLARVEQFASEGKGAHYKPSNIRPVLSFKDSQNLPSDLNMVEGQFTDHYGLVNARVAGGYLSSALEDQVVYGFSLCEECLVELFKSFKEPPSVSDDQSEWASPQRRAEASEENKCLEKEYLARLRVRSPKRAVKKAGKSKTAKKPKGPKTSRP